MNDIKIGLSAAGQSYAAAMHCYVLSYLSGSRSTMPITMIFFPGRMPPRMRPLKGTVYAKYVKVISLERKKTQYGPTY